MGNQGSTKQINVERQVPEMTVPFSSSSKQQASDSCLKERSLKLSFNPVLSEGQELAVTYSDATESFWLVGANGQKIENIGPNRELLRCVLKGYIYKALVQSSSKKSTTIMIIGALR
jgi:hypothetical protein